MLRDSLAFFARYLNQILCLAAHPQAGWNHRRRVFAHRLLVGLILAGDTMLTAIVWRFPNKSLSMKMRYKAVDRMMGEVDLVSVAEQQMEVLGKRVGKDWVIAVDLSDIHKQYATQMESLALVRDGSTGETSVPGYGLITASAVNLNAQEKVLPLPLLFEVFSPASKDYRSQPAIWLEAFDRLMDATPAGTFVVDSEADNGRFFDKMLTRNRHFVFRVKSGNSSRLLLYNKDSRARVRDCWREAKQHGELTVERIAEDGTRSPYHCEYASMPVRLPKHKQTLYLCVFHSPEHAKPIALLTDHIADTPEKTAQVLLMYFSRWVCEEVHRLAKVSFKLENIRFLTYRRLQNMVAMVWIALGAIASYALAPCGEVALRTLEEKSQRVRPALTRLQFWGYAIVDGLREWTARVPRLLHLLPWLWASTQRRAPGPQLHLFEPVH